MFYKAFIRVVKDLTIQEQYMGFTNTNIISERQIEADDENVVKDYIFNKYPQFFQYSRDKIYSRKTKDDAQFFYLIIYPLTNYELSLINKGEWVCAYCGQRHKNRYIDRPFQSTKYYIDLEFCGRTHSTNDDLDDNYDHVRDCFESYKKENMFQGYTEFSDDDVYINSRSNNYIYKICEKATNKSYIGKTKNEPFFRWWNHYKHSETPFGRYLQNTKISDWTFEVIDILPPTSTDKEVFCKESEYMRFFNSIDNGFNTIISQKQQTIINDNQKTLNLL